MHRIIFFFFQAEDGIRDATVTGVQTCALPIFLGRNCPGYGFIDERTPELSVAVAASRRGAGVGSRLLGGLLEAGAAVGYEAVSLSVEADNPALQLYERLGFRKVAQTGGAWTMRLDLRTSVPPTDPVGA